MKERTSKIKFLTIDETARLFTVIKDKRHKAIFLTDYIYGLRASEIGLNTKKRSRFQAVSDYDPSPARIAEWTIPYAR
jgi:integrase